MNDTQITKDTIRPSSGGSGASIPASVGVVLVIAIAVVACILASLIGSRLDLTEHRIYSLSEGTENILQDINESGAEVTIRLFVTEDPDIMPGNLKVWADQVENFLAECADASDGAVVLEVLNPEPDTDAEDTAKQFKIEPVGTMASREAVYLGIAVQCFDQTETIPFVSPEEEAELEFNVISAISKVYREDLPRLYIMTPMEIDGGAMGGMPGAPGGSPRWFLMDQLEGSFDVEIIPTHFTEIPDDADVLLVLHPYDIDDAGQYAIDQYLLRGGKVVAAVDSKFFFADALTPQPNPQMMQMGMPPQPGPSPTSNLGALFDQWGINYSSTQVVADARYATPLGRGPASLVVPSLSDEDAFNQDSPITSQLGDVMLIMPGGFQVQTVDSLVEQMRADAEVLDDMEVSRAIDSLAEFGGGELKNNPEALQEVDKSTEAAQSALEAVAVRQQEAPGASREVSSILSTLSDFRWIAERETRLEVTNLMSSSPANMLAEAVDADISNPDAVERLRSKFRPTGRPLQFALMMTGEFSTAFPDGDPTAPPAPVEDTSPAPAPEPASAEPAADSAPADPPGDAAAEPTSQEEPADAPAEPEVETEAATEGDAPLEEEAAAPMESRPFVANAEAPGQIVLISDVDFLFDGAAVRVQNFGGARYAQFLNQNLSFFMGAIEIVSGDSNLVSLRNRASNRRPFTRLNEIELAAGQRIQEKIEEIQSEKDRLDRELMQQIQTQMAEAEPGSEVEIMLSPEQQEERQRLEEQAGEAASQIRSLEKEVKSDVEWTKGWIKAINILLVPLLIVIIGLTVFAIRQSLLAAR